MPFSFLVMWHDNEYILPKFQYLTNYELFFIVVSFLGGGRVIKALKMCKIYSLIWGNKTFRMFRKWVWFFSRSILLYLIDDGYLFVSKIGLFLKLTISLLVEMWRIGQSFSILVYSLLRKIFLNYPFPFR